MYVLATFEHSISLELAISVMEKKGLGREKILAVPLERKMEENKLFDSIHHSDGISLFDASAALGTVFMILGVIYGFVLAWGPVIWALIGLFSGVALGFLGDFFFSGRRRKSIQQHSKIATEVILIVHCEESQAEMVEKVLCANLALGIAKIKG